jgi:uncharacterized protein YndB with AHSA1/START domain
VVAAAKPFILELKRVLRAPADTVFETLTVPDRLAKWWGPHGFATLDIDVDLRVGGSYRFTMQPPDGDPFHLSGEYLDIDPPRRLSFSFRWEEPTPDDRETVVMLMLESVAEATRLSLSHGEFATEERLALHRGGWTESFEKMEALLRTATP